MGDLNMAGSIDAMLNPRRVAIIGASKDPGKRGFRAIKTLLDGKYSGEIIPINPRETEILGLRCYATLGEVSHPIDLALIYTPTETVPDIVEQCGKYGVRGVAVIASGFSEVGESGRILEQRVAETARQFNMRVIGPTINGIFSARYNFNAIGWYDIPHGHIALLCNSANLPLSMLIEAQTYRGAGFSTILSVGNQADVQFHEYIASLGEDVGTRVIASYVEGFKDGRAYLAAVRRVASQKPIVVYKAGRNSVGVRLAKSHSGSLAGDYAVACGVLKQAGVILTNRFDCLFSVADALSLLPPMSSRRVAIISEGGGVLTIAAETLADRGMIVASLSEETQRKIRAILPTSSAISNPIDIGSGTLPRAENYGKCARVVLEDPNIDAVLFVGYFGGYTKRYAKWLAEKGGQAAHENEICEELAHLMAKFGKPIVVQSYYANSHPEGLDILRKAGIPYYRSVEVAVECLCAVADYTATKRRISDEVPAKAFSRAESADRLVTSCRLDGREALLEHEAKDLLRAYGISVPQEILVQNKQDLEAIPASFENRFVAMKIVSKSISHKSDIGGVKLNILGKSAMRIAFDEITMNVRAHKPDAEILGVLVSPMADKGVEVLIGSACDPQFGPIIMFGLGGIFVEVIKDVAIRALPISSQEARDMIGGIKCKEVFDGVRGMPPVDKEALVDLLLKVSSICGAHPEIAELDLNPVIAHARGYSVVDARIIVRA